MYSLTHIIRLIQNILALPKYAGPQHAERHAHEIVQLQQQIGQHNEAQTDHKDHTQSVHAADDDTRNSSSLLWLLARISEVNALQHQTKIDNVSRVC